MRAIENAGHRAAIFFSAEGASLPYPVEVKKGLAPSKPTKNFRVLAKYKMPVKRGMVIENAERMRTLNDDAFVFPVSLLGA